MVEESGQIGFLKRLFQSALDAADPMKVVPPYLPSPPKGRTVVVGVGKAAAAMAQAVEANWSAPLEGVVVVPEGAALPTQFIRVHESSHPVPDERSVEGARLLMDAVSGLTEEDLVIALISGGGSALCALPAEGLTLENKQMITRELLKRGAAISEINTVRKHLSAIKGGRLAALASPARVVSLIISDIPGDDPAMVASGPTMPDASTCEEALSLLQRYGLDDIPVVRDSLASGLWESVKPNDASIKNHSYHLIATAWDGVSAAAAQAKKEGVTAYILSDAMEGEAREMAKTHAGIALSVAGRDVPFVAPCVIITGGEATVTLKGDGRGGRNTEFVLALAIALDEHKERGRVYALSAGTDGLDGSAGAAGAWLAPESLSLGRGLGLEPQAYLDDNDSATFLNQIGALVHTGATFTNINDFRAILIEAAGE